VFWPQVQQVSWSDNVLIGAGLSLTGAFLASIGNMISAAAQRNRLSVMPTTAWSMLYGGLLNLGLALGQGNPLAFDTSAAYVSSLLFLAVFGSVIAFGCYLTLLGRIGADRAGYVVVVIPVVAIILSAQFEGLALDLNVLVGAALALGGNFAVLMKGPAPQPAPPRSP